MTWQYLLHHLGHWRGSFTRLSPYGELNEDIPSLVTLDGLDDNTKIRQVVQHFDPHTQAVTYEKVLEYGSLSRSTLIFADGSFSQGSMQLGPFDTFGAEFGFVDCDRRLRLVQLFESGGTFDQITLIREHREGTPEPQRVDLAIDQLLGTWQGELTTIYPDLRSPTVATSTLHLARNDNQIQQTLHSEGFSLSTSAKLDGNRLLFESGTQVLFLPDGASSTCPLQLPKGRPFQIEVGWLVAPDRRLRMIRRYDAQGGWSSLVLVKEHKIG
ncbi:MAG: DUF3598 family protein [Thainema sp.]